MDEDEHSDEMDAEVDDSPVELTLEEKETLLKKSRWNVFLSLGLAIIMFILSLVPISTGLVVDSYSKDYDTGQLYGIPISGADFTDIPTDVVLTIEQLPVSTKSIDVFLIEAESCVIESNGIMQEYTDKDGNTLTDIRLEIIENGPRHQWQHAVIDAPVIGQEYVLSFEVDPGMYCMQIITDAEFKTPNSVNVDVQFKFYPFQIIAGVIAIISLGLSIFAFIGAQKHGQWVRDAKLPTGKSVEQEILDQTSQERISAGPSGPPSGPSGPPSSSGPSGPPSSSGPAGPPEPSGPSGPPAPSGPAGPPEPSGPSGPPASSGPAGPPEPSGPPASSGPAGPPEPSGPPASSGPAGPPDAVPNDQAETAEQPPWATDGSVFEPQGDGYYFRKMTDGSYDQTVYYVGSDGEYVPYEA